MGAILQTVVIACQLHFVVNNNNFLGGCMRGFVLGSNGERAAAINVLITRSEQGYEYELGEGSTAIGNAELAELLFSIAVHLITVDMPEQQVSAA